MLHKIKLQDELTQDFCQLPLFLFKNDRYKNMKIESKVIYSFMKDRVSLSIKNNWINEENDIYIIMTNYEIMELMGCSEPKVIVCKKELKEYGLIQEIRQGFNRPNLIFVLVDKDITYYKKSIKKNAVEEVKENSLVEDIEKSDTKQEEVPDKKQQAIKHSITDINDFFKKVWDLGNRLDSKDRKDFRRNKSQANKRTNILKLMELGYKEIEKSFENYRNYVRKTRLEGFKDLRYMNGGKFFTSSYEDYLEETPEAEVNELSEDDLFNGFVGYEK